MWSVGERDRWPSARGRGAIEARLELRAAPASAGQARRFVADTLRSWGHPQLIDVGTLLASELVTNAVLHARSDVVVVLSVTRGVVRIAVSDTSQSVPVMRHYDDDAMTGRGLALVAELSRNWGVEDRRNGKVVWFELPGDRARLC